ncbi:CatB-related O-acetyltransferase [Pacificoceanicola onchidii]|uniref:CatB-related O-acetyltransferase n=1 Tax=Pacificoceanicola onchidii TaxID=2562685 RepID=UPI0010A3EEE0|nr:CatB-related O-acetyltransferase [Pacificoceanicola onchidii]
MPFKLPSAQQTHPITLPDGTAHPGTVFLRAVIDHPRMEIGEYTYASDFGEVGDWAGHLAPYLFPFSQETLKIGKFCQIAHGVRFITASANHATRGPSTFPFPVFDPDTMVGYQPDQRDTVIGNDVWLGYGALVLPGAQIGNGVIVGAGAVVRGKIPDYAVVAGNPAQVIRQRYPEREVAILNRLAWWDWPAEVISEAAESLQKDAPDDLLRYAEKHGLL